jgi:hypothetical protein
VRVSSKRLKHDEAAVRPHRLVSCNATQCKTPTTDNCATNKVHDAGGAPLHCLGCNAQRQRDQLAAASLRPMKLNDERTGVGSHEPIEPAKLALQPLSTVSCEAEEHLAVVVERVIAHLRARRHSDRCTEPHGAWDYVTWRGNWKQCAFPGGI